MSNNVPVRPLNSRDIVGKDEIRALLESFNVNKEIVLKSVDKINVGVILEEWLKQ